MAGGVRIDGDVVEVSSEVGNKLIGKGVVEAYQGTAKAVNVGGTIEKPAADVSIEVKPPEEKVVAGKLPEWKLKTSPAEYLRKHPNGPNAELAKEIIKAG